MRTSAVSPPPTRLSSCAGFAYWTLSRFLVSLRYCSASFDRPGATADAQSTLMSAATAAAGRTHARTSVASLTSSSSPESLVDARGDEERLALGATQIAHEGFRELGVR